MMITFNPLPKVLFFELAIITNEAKIAEHETIPTPVYTTTCCIVQNRSGSRIRCDVASHIPATSSTATPETARMETMKIRVFVLETRELENAFECNIWIKLILNTIYRMLS